MIKNLFLDAKLKGSRIISPELFYLAGFFERQMSEIYEHQVDYILVRLSSHFITDRAEKNFRVMGMRFESKLYFPPRRPLQ